MMTEPATRLTRFLQVTGHIEDGILISLLAVMIGLAVTQILLRNLLGIGLYWAGPLLRILVLWVGLAGAIVATREDNHIAISILPRYLPPRARTGVRIGVDLFTFFISAVVAYHAARFVAMEYEFPSMAFAAVPTWLSTLILPVAFTIIALRYLAFAVVHLRQLLTGGRRE